MPRRISDYPDAFTGWNFISSIGSIISVAATALFLHIVYLQLVKGKAIFGYPWAVPQLFSDYLRILKDKSAPGLEWALHNPPKPHAFTSLPLQSVGHELVAKTIYPGDWDKYCRNVVHHIWDPSMRTIMIEEHTLAGREDVNPTTYMKCINCYRVYCSWCYNNSGTLKNQTTGCTGPVTQNGFFIFTVGSIIRIPYLTVLISGLAGMFEIYTPCFIFALQPLIEVYRIYKLPSRILKFLSLLERIYNFIINSKWFSSSILGLVVISTLLLSTAEFGCDAPRAWGLYFQDSASPQMEALVELHDNIMYYLVAILFAVGWIQGAIIRNFDSSKSPISNKYLNHGINVPTQKYSKFSAINLLNHKVLLPVRTYSTSTNKDQDQYNTKKSNLDKDSINPLVYVNAYSMKKTILKENTGKSGIYMWTNLLTGDIYIGQSPDLSKRFRKYFTISYIKSRKELIISRALIKYGYANFSVSILEYCDRCDLTAREQHYLDKFYPQYNILKIAGSSLGFKPSEETKLKISKALKGIYTGDKSALFGRFHTEETKKIMSLSKAGENNPLYGKTHNEDTKELMRQRALNRKHSCETKDKMSKTHGNPVTIYEKSSSKGFELIGSFVSARRAAKLLGISGSTVIKYMQSGAIFKDRYKFSSK